MSSLIIDVGSSSVRALFYHPESAFKTPRIARRIYHFDSDGQVDAHQLRQWVEMCIDDVLMQHPNITIQSVGMATFVGNFLGVDEANMPTTPLYTYADNRSRASVTHLLGQVDAQLVHQRTGCRVHTAYHPAKLHWLKTTQPSTVAQTTRWLDFATYCYEAWFGRAVPCSYSIASWSGLLNRETHTWDAEWLALLGIDESQLPPLADYDDVQSGLGTPYAERWRALRDVPFYLAIGDGAGANIGSGGISSAHPVLTVGTTAAIRLITTQPQPAHDALWSYRVDADHHLIGGATNEGGNIFAWAKNTLHLSASDIEEALMHYEPASQGLIALPLLNGERSPNYNDSATGTLHGITLNTTALDILYAMLAGVACRLRLILDALDMPSDYIFAGGGALQASRAWTQIFADVLERPLYLVTENEVTVRGVYLLINNRAWSEPSPDVPQQMQFYPRLAYADRYAEMRHQQHILYEQLYHKGR